MVAPAQGDEGGNPGEVENPGEHRAPNGINPRLGATNSRGEKGPEDEPISQRTACLRFTRCGGLRSDVLESGEHPVCKRGASFGWWHVGKTCDGCGARIRSVTTAYRRPPDPVIDHGASHGRALPRRSGFGRPGQGTTAVGFGRPLTQVLRGGFGRRAVSGRKACHLEARDREALCE